MRTTVLGAALAVGLAAVTACGSADPMPQGPSVGLPADLPSPTPTEDSGADGKVARMTNPSTPISSPADADTGTDPEPAPPSEVNIPPNDQFGPFGWRTLFVGQSIPDAKALGMADDPLSDGDLCQVWPARPTTPLHSLLVHPEHGVVRINAVGVTWLHTVEGMHVGWTTADVAAAYPDFTPVDPGNPYGTTVAVPGNPGAEYRLHFDESDVLVRMSLEKDADLCLT